MEDWKLSTSGRPFNVPTIPFFSIIFWSLTASLIHQRLVLPNVRWPSLPRSKNQWNLRSHVPNLLLFPKFVLLIHLINRGCGYLADQRVRIANHFAMLIPQSNTIEKDVEYWEKNRQFTSVL